MRFLLVLARVAGCERAEVAIEETGDTAAPADTDVVADTDADTDEAPDYAFTTTYGCVSIPGFTYLSIVVDGAGEEYPGFTCSVAQDGADLGIVHLAPLDDGTWEARPWVEDLGVDCADPETIGVVCEVG